MAMKGAIFFLGCAMSLLLGVILNDIEKLRFVAILLWMMAVMHLAIQCAKSERVALFFALIFKSFKDFTSAVCLSVFFLLMVPLWISFCAGLLGTLLLESQPEAYLSQSFPATAAIGLLVLWGIGLVWLNRRVLMLLRQTRSSTPSDTKLS